MVGPGRCALRPAVRSGLGGDHGPGHRTGHHDPHDGGHRGPAPAAPRGGRVRGARKPGVGRGTGGGPAAAGSRGAGRRRAQRQRESAVRGRRGDRRRVCAAERRRDRPGRGARPGFGPAGRGPRRRRGASEGALRTAPDGGTGSGRGDAGGLRRGGVHPGRCRGRDRGDRFGGGFGGGVAARFARLRIRAAALGRALRGGIRTDRGRPPVRRACSRGPVGRRRCTRYGHGILDDGFLRHAVRRKGPVIRTHGALLAAPRAPRRPDQSRVEVRRGGALPFPSVLLAAGPGPGPSSRPCTGGVPDDPPQFLRDLLEARPHRRLLVQEDGQDPCQPRCGGGQLRFLVQHGVQCRQGRRAGERRVPAEGRAERRAEGPHVRRRTLRAARDPLRGHVVRRAHQHPDHGERLGVLDRGDAEVREDHAPPPAFHKHVPRLDVPVQDASRVHLP